MGKGNEKESVRMETFEFRGTRRKDERLWGKKGEVKKKQRQKKKGNN